MTRKEKKYYTPDEKIIKLSKLNKKINGLEQKIIKTENKLNNLKKKDKQNNRTINEIIKLSNYKMKVEQNILSINKEKELLENNELEKLSILKSIIKWFSNISYKNQVKTWGIIFITPWLLGMLLFFIPSVLKTIGWSFNEITISGGIISSKFKGFENFSYLFTGYVVDVSSIFSTQLLFFVQNLIIDLPIIIIFSIIIAVLLNKEFKGHVLIKAIFFIPVIYNIALITATMSSGFGTFIEDSLSSSAGFLDKTVDFLMQIGIGESIVTFVVSAVDRIFTIVNRSGIQILIFIAAIQSIPTHLYEAAEVEGATKYESFWKITIPMITPMILTAAIFTVVDSFSSAPIFRFLQDATTNGNYGLAAAISVTYFVINVAIIGFIYLLFKGRVFYHDEK